MVAAVLAGQHWVLVPLAYGFAARVASGPRVQPARPARHEGDHAASAGRAQARARPAEALRPSHRRGASVSALVSWAAFGNTTVALLLVAAIGVAATLESVFAYCIGCKVFAFDARGVIPPEVCEACNDLSLRTRSDCLLAANSRDFPATFGRLSASSDRGP